MTIGQFSNQHPFSITADGQLGHLVRCPPKRGTPCHTKKGDIWCPPKRETQNVSPKGRHSKGRHGNMLFSAARCCSRCISPANIPSGTDAGSEQNSALSSYHPLKKPHYYVHCGTGLCTVALWPVHKLEMQWQQYLLYLLIERSWFSVVMWCGRKRKVSVAAHCL